MTSASLWHLTDDAARTPARPIPGELVTVRIGSWPKNVANVRVAVTVERGTASATDERPAQLVAGAGANRYWEAGVGRFERGDRVSYRAVGEHEGREVSSRVWKFRVGPRAHVMLLWHHHQPWYRDLGAVTGAGALQMPWVRLHAVRDYLGMALRLRAVPGVNVVFNLTPSLIAQLGAYDEGATDRALELTLTPAEQLDDRDRDELLHTFFDADWHRQIFLHPRYQELFDARQAGRPLDPQEVRDLQMWFNLAWCCHELRTGEVALPGGKTASVARFVAQGRDFTPLDIAAMVDEQRKVLRAIVPLYRELAAEGRVELTTTPYYHPILPILIEPSGAMVDRDGAIVPADLAFGEDGEVQVARSASAHERWFGMRATGLWPAEGAVSEAMLPLLERHGVRWIATDQAVLARSGKWGYEVTRPPVRHAVYRAERDGARVAVFFRDTALSDAIGFWLHRRDPDQAAADLVDALETRARELPAEGDFVITIALDGENAWGAYRDDGRPFLEGLYRRLASATEIETTTGVRFLAEHSVDDLPRVHELATASWIDEAGSRGGADLGTWIGEADENAAWTLLSRARAALATSGELRGTAYEALLAAEGSDWFWWLGADQDSGRDDEFDLLFRRHVGRAYQLAGLRVPDEMTRGLPLPAVVWSFTRKVATIPRDRPLLIRTNCPGSVTWSVDGGAPTRAPLQPTGGVLAGARRFQVALGPFADGRVLRFRYRCNDEECHCPGGCIPDEQTVQIS